MARLIFDLRGVPDDEGDDIRALLQEQGIAFYETRPAPLGLFAGGIWVGDDGLAAPAKAAIADYQAARRDRARGEYQAALREGRAESLWTSLRAQPLKVLLLLLAVLAVVAFTVLPFLLLGDFAGPR